MLFSESSVLIFQQIGVEMNKYSLILMGTLIACGEKSDITSEIAGDYNGSITSDAITSTNYTVTVSAVDEDTIAISGDDFTTVEVDVMNVAGLITNVLSDEETTLSLENGDLDFTHSGTEEVTFSGSLILDTGL